MRTRIAIDPNVRVRQNETYAGFEDVDGLLQIGTTVEVWEPESGIAGHGRITEIDWDRALVYLSVEWASLRESPGSGPRLKTGLDSAVRLRLHYSAAIHEEYGGDCQWTTRASPVVTGPQILENA